MATPTPTPNELARLKEELESALQLMLSLEIYYTTEKFSEIVEGLTKKVLAKQFNLNEEEIDVEHLYDTKPDPIKFIENTKTSDDKPLVIEKIESWDLVIAEFTIDKQSIAIKITIRYESTYIQVGDIHLQKLLTPIYVEDIKIKEARE